MRNNTNKHARANPITRARARRNRIGDLAEEGEEVGWLGAVRKCRSFSRRSFDCMSDYIGGGEWGSILRKRRRDRRQSGRTGTCSSVDAAAPFPVTILSRRDALYTNPTRSAPLCSAPIGRTRPEARGSIQLDIENSVEYFYWVLQGDPQYCKTQKKFQQSFQYSIELNPGCTVNTDIG